ncbi:unnamed protein product [marine sediment metagenome]|uniref:Uncharacterized protein n=1 Tax=marine sediment metagenome TaxID=412755 RepID=X1DGV1_9ZZZZ
MSDCALGLGKENALKPGGKADYTAKECAAWQEPPVDNIIGKF